MRINLCYKLPLIPELKFQPVPAVPLVMMIDYTYKNMIQVKILIQFEVYWYIIA